MTKWMFVAILPILLHVCNAEKTVDELLDSLVSYDHRKSPLGSRGKGSPIEIMVSLYILDMKVDDVKEEISTLMYFRQSWKDSRLEFKDEEDKLLHYQDWARIWTPDLYFVNENHGKFHSVPIHNTYARWKPDGTVFISMRLTMSFRCNMDMGYYPHDEHKCSLHVESFANGDKKIALTWKIRDTEYNAVGIAEKIHEKNFKVVRLNHSEYILRDNTGNYSRLTIDLIFKRNAGFFVTKLYIPYILLAIVAWLSLWINPRFVALRLSLLLSVLLAMFLLALDMNGYIPRVTYTKGTDVWTGFCISLVFALLLEFVFLAQKSQKEEVQELSHIATDTAPSENAKKKDSKFFPLKFTIFQPKSYGGRSDSSQKADHALRFIFPLLFGLFNLIYWSVYTS